MVVLHRLIYLTPQKAIKSISCAILKGTQKEIIFFY